MKALGPYLRPDGRKIMVITLPNGKKTTKTYAKYLMEQHLGRELHPDLDTVDHIDQDKSNDVLTNLQILTRSEHSKKDAKRVKKVTQPCLTCGSLISEIPRNVRSRVRKGQKGPFCNKSCAGKFRRV